MTRFQVSNAAPATANGAIINISASLFDINVLAYRSRPNVAEDQVPSRYANGGMSGVVPACRGYSDDVAVVLKPRPQVE
jgi:hypothetical protein